MMTKERFDELRLQDETIICEFCKDDFNLRIEDTIGGGYGVVGIKCPLCKRRFGLTRGGAK